jgi:ribosomal protein S18 acetylase RimI-like enzyme
LSDTWIVDKVDRNGEKVSLVYSNSIGGGPVVPFFLKNYAELMENGHAHNFIMGTNKSKAIYAVIDGKVAGHIIFDILDDAIKTAWIVFSCVDKDYRHRGLYTMMHEELENQAKKMGSSKIASHVHVNNNTRQASCISVGMMPVFYRMEKEL